MQKGKNKMLAYILLLMYVLAGALGMTLIKKGGATTKFALERFNISVSFSGIFVIGMLLYLLSFLIWIYILQVFPLTYISPVSYGMVFISLAIFSRLILKEQITQSQILGAVLIIMGIIIASKKG